MLGTLPLRPLPMTWAVQGTNGQFNVSLGPKEFTETPVASQKLSELRAAPPPFFFLLKARKEPVEEELVLAGVPTRLAP